MGSRDHKGRERSRQRDDVCHRDDYRGRGRPRRCKKRVKGLEREIELEAIKLSNNKERLKGLEGKRELESRRDRNTQGSGSREKRLKELETEVELEAVKLADSKKRVKELKGKIKLEAKSKPGMQDEREEEQKYRERNRGRERESGDVYDDGRGRKRRSTSRPEMGRRNESQEDGESHDRREQKDGRDLHDEPKLSRVYKGRVSRVMDTGYFVKLDGFEGKEGWLQVKDCFKRDQEVYVKVISKSGQELGLSMMRGVDQTTGRDLSTSGVDYWLRTCYGGFPVSRRITKEDDAMPSSRPLKRITLTQKQNNWLREDAPCIVFDPCPPPWFREDPSPIVCGPCPWFAEDTQSEDATSIPRYLNPVESALIEERIDFVSKNFNGPFEFSMLETGGRHLGEGEGLLSVKKTDGKALERELSMQEKRQSLPIYKYKDEMIQAVHNNQIMVVIGEIGSGKTTQMTQYLVEGGFTTKGKIGCTQHRRVAAKYVARRVAEEFGCCTGEEVGYAVSFEECIGPRTIIEYMVTDVLLEEIMADENLSQYSVIILDDAHERTIHTDVLLGVLKQLVQRRSDLRLIVTTTLDAEKFSGYFFNCNIFSIAPRCFPVEILYTREPVNGYFDSALMTVLQIHLTEPEGDILLFLTDQDEIDNACLRLAEGVKGLGKTVPQMFILPFYRALSCEKQSSVFEPAPSGTRKVIATNMDEASLAMDGILYVIDPGFANQIDYDAKQGLHSRHIKPISQASAKQRAMHAGRTGPGKCYRLYTESAFQNEMSPTRIPEILTTNLVLTVLNMKAMGIDDILNFEFMDPPSPEALASAREQLCSFGALDGEGVLTKLGKIMIEFPLQPPTTKMLLASVDLGCSDEILTIVAIIRTGNIFHRPRNKQALADQRRTKLFQPEGDHLTLLAIYKAWKATNFSESWCIHNFIKSGALKMAENWRNVLLSIMDKHKLDVVSAGENFTNIRKAITAGFFFQVARRDPQEGYRTLVENQQVYIHPSSALFQRQPDWVIYHELVMNATKYMHVVTILDPKWLAELAPSFLKVAKPINEQAPETRMY